MTEPQRVVSRSRLFNFIVLAVIISVLCYVDSLQRAERQRREAIVKKELDRRKVWMAEVEAFKNGVESQMDDRWTKTDHDTREAEVFNALFRDNPKLIRPTELEFEE